MTLSRRYRIQRRLIFVNATGCKKPTVGRSSRQYRTASTPRACEPVDLG